MVTGQVLRVFSFCLVRDALEKKPFNELTLEEATKVIKECVRICYLRDCRASSQYHLANITKDGVTLDEPVTIDSDWEYAKNIKGYE